MSALAAVSLLAAALAPLRAHAEAPTPNSVGLRFTGADADRDAFALSLAELLQRLGVRLAPEDQGTLGGIEVDWTAPGEGQLTIRDPVGKVVLLRLLARREKGAVALEAAAHIAQSVVEELRDVERKKPLKATGPAPLPDPEVTLAVKKKAPRTGGPVALDVGGFINARLWGGGAPFAVGFGLNATVALANTRFRPGLWWSGGYQPPFQVSNDFAQLLVHVVPLRLGAQVSLFGGENWRLDTAVAGGADLFITATRSDVLPPGVLGRPRADASPILSAQVTGRFGIARIADLWLGFMLDVDLAPRRYVVDVQGDRQELFLPWRVRPALMLGFSFTPVGSDPYAGRSEEAQ